jgi:hypothetical protein
MDDRTGYDDRTRRDERAMTMEDDDTRDQRVHEIRSDIEQTRGDLSETVDAIQERLRPSNVMARAASATADKAKETARNAADTAEEWWDASPGPGFVDRIRAHPVPAAMCAIGLAWLAFGNGHSREWHYRRTVPRPARPEDYSRGYSRDYSRRSEDDSPRYSPSDSGRYMRDSAATARRAFSQGRSRVETMLQQYPLAVGAAALIIGASLGLAVPETERENELMGEARDTAVQKAQEAATGAVTRAKEAAADVVVRAAINPSEQERKS